MDFNEYNERIRRFIEFLRGVNNKKRGEKIDPTYRSGHINLSVIFVGSAATMNSARYGYEPYLNYIKRAISEGVSVFYILAKGKLNTSIANYIARLLEEQNTATITHVFSDTVKCRNQFISVVCKRLEVC